MANQVIVDIENNIITIKDIDRYLYTLTEWKTELSTKIKKKKVTLAPTGILEDDYRITLCKESILIQQLARRLIFTKLTDSRI